MSRNRILNIDIRSLKTLDGYNILRDIYIELNERETLCIIGESGSGKSMLGFSVMGLLPPNLLFNGKIEYYKDGNLFSSDPKVLRGREISMIFQEPMTALNPLFTIGHQLEEIAPRVGKEKKRQIVLDALRSVGIKNTEKVYMSYPHQISGGMRQRALIAMAFLGDPSIVIADEPTTALDVTVASGILSLLRQLRDEKNISLIFITHDLNIVEKIAERIVVMYGGTIMEMGDRDTILNNPHHPYTLSLRSLFEERKKKRQVLPEIKGFVPSIRDMPSGCPFHPRCNYSDERCKGDLPRIESLTNSHIIRCLHHLKVTGR